METTINRLYEINTRVWIKRFGVDVKTVNDVPLKYWEDLKAKGIDAVWLMGVWKTSKVAVKKYNFEEGLRIEYNNALKDWSKEDVIGSPYAIDEYVFNKELGSADDFTLLKKKLNDIGIRLILDFIPNHYSAESDEVKNNPDVFLDAENFHFQNNPHTFFKKASSHDKIFAHGRDPFFPAWQDTIQVNYFNPAAREFMQNTLLSIVKYCDGLRCDMAMLVLNNVFKNTWSSVLEDMNYKKPETEFWHDAIKKVKEVNNSFVFIAEAYWDLEWELQQLGFDFTYDKSLTDRLIGAPPIEIREHLEAEEDYQRKSLRFIENHDEDRVMMKMGKNKSRAAAVIISTLQGLSFYYDGQFEGKRIKLPVQLGREPEEIIDNCIVDYYNLLLKITNDEIFKKGEWKLLDVNPSWSEDNSFTNLIAWQWELDNRRMLVVVNYADVVSAGRIQLEVESAPEEINFDALLMNEKYSSDKSEINSEGLYIELPNFKSHILEYFV